MTFELVSGSPREFFKNYTTKFDQLGGLLSVLCVKSFSLVITLKYSTQRSQRFFGFGFFQVI